jgi:hypothetical protein
VRGINYWRRRVKTTSCKSDTFYVPYHRVTQYAHKGEYPVAKKKKASCFRPASDFSNASHHKWTQYRVSSLHVTGLCIRILEVPSCQLLPFDLRDKCSDSCLRCRNCTMYIFYTCLRLDVEGKYSVCSASTNFRNYY